MPGPQTSTSRALTWIQCELVKQYLVKIKGFSRLLLSFVLGYVQTECRLKYANADTDV